MNETLKRLSRAFDPAAGFAVAMLALIGLVKAQGLQDLLPLDATMIALILCFGLCVAAIIARRRVPVEVAWVTLFMVGMLPALVWGHSPANTYAADKVPALLLIVPACLAAPVVLLVTDRARRWFLGFVVATAVIPLCIVLSTTVDPLYGRATVADLNPIGIGRVLASAAVVTAIYGLRVHDMRGRAVCGLATMALLAAVWRTGSRGPLLAAFLAVVLVVLIALTGRASRRVWISCGAGAVVAAAGVLFLLTFDDGALLHRTTGESDSERVALYEKSLQLLLTHPQGIGWGNLVDYLDPGQVIVNQGSTQYAHNILLEVGVEGGWIALAALLVLTVVSFRRLFQRRASHADAALLGLWVFAFVVAMTSSDFTSNRLTLVMLGVGLLRPTPSTSLLDPVSGRSTGIRHVESRPGTAVGPPPR